MLEEEDVPDSRPSVEEARKRLGSALIGRVHAEIMGSRSDWDVPKERATTPGSKPGCSVEGCPDDARQRGMCGAHYQRWRRGR
jgi:hypothetical protein